MNKGNSQLTSVLDFQVGEAQHLASWPSHHLTHLRGKEKNWETPLKFTLWRKRLPIRPRSNYRAMESFLCLPPLPAPPHHNHVVVELLSRVRLFVTPWTAASQASLSFTISWGLLRLMSIKSVILFNYLILCCPLLLLPLIFSTIKVFSNRSVLCIRWPK